MSAFGKALVCLMSSFMVSTGAEAIVADSANPYQGIVDRNVFGLKPLPPPPKTGADADKPQVPKITLTGVVKLLGKKFAFMTVPVPPKPGEPAKPPQSLMIAPGEAENEIEVLDIDEKAEGGTVKVKNHGTEQTLTMEKDSPKLTASAAPAVPIPGAPNPGGIVPPASFPSGNINVPTPSGMKSIPTRTLRTPGIAQPQTGAMVTPGGLPAPGMNYVQGAYPRNGATPTPAPPVINPDEQAMNMLAQHVQHTDQGIPMPPLPPPLAEVLDGSGQQTQPPVNNGPPRPQ
jgi:hypothetical protein